MTQVTLKLAQVVFDTTDARSAAEFWRQLLGLVYKPGDEQPVPGEDDPAVRDWLNLRLPEGTPLLAFQQVTEHERSTWPEQRVPQQLHLDLTVRDVAELDAVHARVIELGVACGSTDRMMRRSRFWSSQTLMGTRSACSSPTISSPTIRCSSATCR